MTLRQRKYLIPSRDEPRSDDSTKGALRKGRGHYRSNEDSSRLRLRNRNCHCATRHIDFGCNDFRSESDLDYEKLHHVLDRGLYSSP